MRAGEWMDFQDTMINKKIGGVAFATFSVKYSVDVVKPNRSQLQN
jgi:hypothetical protein